MTQKSSSEQASLLREKLNKSLRANLQKKFEGKQPRQDDSSPDSSSESDLSPDHTDPQPSPHQVLVDKKVQEEKERLERLAQDKSAQEEKERLERLAQEKSAQEEKERQERLAREKSAQEEKERQERLAQEKSAQEEKERLERLAREKSAQEEKERLERLAREKFAQEEKERQERLAREKSAQEEKERQERLAREKSAQEEKERQERLAREKSAQEEKERLLKESKKISTSLKLPRVTLSVASTEDQYGVAQIKKSSSLNLKTPKQVENKPDSLDRQFIRALLFHDTQWLRNQSRFQLDSRKMDLILVLASPCPVLLDALVFAGLDFSIDQFPLFYKRILSQSFYGSLSVLHRSFTFKIDPATLEVLKNWQKKNSSFFITLAADSPRSPKDLLDHFNAFIQDQSEELLSYPEVQDIHASVQQFYGLLQMLHSNDSETEPPSSESATFETENTVHPVESIEPVSIAQELQQAQSDFIVLQKKFDLLQLDHHTLTQQHDQDQERHQIQTQKNQALEDQLLHLNSTILDLETQLKNERANFLELNITLKNTQERWDQDKKQSDETQKIHQAVLRQLEDQNKYAQDLEDTLQSHLAELNEFEKNKTHLQDIESRHQALLEQCAILQENNLSLKEEIRVLQDKNQSLQIVQQSNQNLMSLVQQLESEIFNQKKITQEIQEEFFEYKKNPPLIDYVSSINPSEMISKSTFFDAIAEGHIPQIIHCIEQMERKPSPEDLQKAFIVASFKGKILSFSWLLTQGIQPSSSTLLDCLYFASRFNHVLMMDCLYSWTYPNLLFSYEDFVFRLAIEHQHQEMMQWCLSKGFKPDAYHGRHLKMLENHPHAHLFSRN